MTTSKTTIASYHKAMAKFFTATADEQARATQFVQRRSPISGSGFLWALIGTVYAQGIITLPGVVDQLEAATPSCAVSEQAVDQRFTAEAVAFLMTMLGLALQQTVTVPPAAVPALAGFTAVYLLDSSTIPLPAPLRKVFPGCGGGGSVAAAKLYLVWDWLRGQCAQLEIRHGRQPDQRMGIPCLAESRTGALWIFDLGFWSGVFLAAIAAAGSYFLTRLQSQVTVYGPDGHGAWTRIDLDALLRAAPRDRVFELAIGIGAQDRLACRLICAPVPRAVANQRRRRVREAARQKQKGTPSQRRLRRCDWTLLVTTASVEQLPTTAVLPTYGIRWQVELLFKVAKSRGAQLEHTLSADPHRVQCELYAKLIAWLLFLGVLALVRGPDPGRLSVSKAWARGRTRLRAWSLAGHPRGGWSGLRALIATLRRRSTMNRRRRQPSTWEQIQRTAVQAQTCCLRDPLGYLKWRKTHKGVGDQFFVSSAARLPAGGLA